MPYVFFPQEETRMERRWVYFIEAVGLGLIKIGVANSVRARMAQLEKMSPAPLKELCRLETDRLGSLEKELHRRFAEYRSHGEWFRAEPPILAFIAENA